MVDVYNVFTAGGTAGNFVSINLTQSVSNTDSDTIDLGAGTDAFGAALDGPDVGMGKPVFCNIMIDQLVTVAGTAGTATCKFVLYGANSTSGSPNNWDILVQTDTLTITQLNLPYKIFFAIPPAVLQGMRWLKVNQITGTEGFTAGKYYAWLSGEPLPTK